MVDLGIFSWSSDDNVMNKQCEECGSGDDGDKLLLCDKCDLGFHLFCLTPVLASVPHGPWFCRNCSNHNNPRIFPLLQSKITGFFILPPRKSSEPLPHFKQGTSPLPFTDTRFLCWKKKRRKRCSVVLVSKKKRKLVPFLPIQDPARRFQQMQSLATALTATGTQFSNQLTYMPGMAPVSANRPSFEKGGMQVLSKENTQTLGLCKTMMKRGECPPLMVVFDHKEGFTVEADGLIRDLTIVAEYVGDVDYLRNREKDDGGCMMTLISSPDPSKNLVICPDKRGNITRFINGINNHIVDGKKKQNLKCVRFDVHGECRALLIAIRDISKGERLYYDYNGHEHEYPTHHFL